jgi:hypothetical protein
MPAHELRALARQIRREAADEIERLIALLDRIEPDPDLEGAYHGHGLGTEDDEPGHDDEMTAPENYGKGWSQPRPVDDNDDDEDGHDREDDPGENGIADRDGLAEQLDGEPSLGSFDRMWNQEKSYRQHAGPTAYNGFAVIDAELDDADREPSLGANGAVDQSRWGIGGRDDRELDPAEMGEPEDYFA